MMEPPEVSLQDAVSDVRDARTDRSWVTKLKGAYWTFRVRIWVSFARPLVRAARLYAQVPISTWLVWPFLRSRRDGEVHVRVSGLTEAVILRSGTSDFDVFRGVFLDLQYDHPDRGQAVSSIIDCGANIGLASLYFIRRYPLSRIIAIEPDPDNFAIAERNLDAYRERVALLRAAVWSDCSQLRLVRNSFRDGRDWATQVAVAPNGETVDGVTLGRVIERYGLAHVDILKVDIEGAEKALFTGDCSFLDVARCVLIEIHDAECGEAFMAAMDRYGFETIRGGITTIAIRR